MGCASNFTRLKNHPVVQEAVLYRGAGHIFQSMPPGAGFSASLLSVAHQDRILSTIKSGGGVTGVFVKGEAAIRRLRA